MIVYNAFKSVLEQTVTTEQLLPIERTVILDEDDDDEDDEHAPEPRPRASSSPSPRTS